MDKSSQFGAHGESGPPEVLWEDGERRYLRAWRGGAGGAMESGADYDDGYGGGDQVRYGGTGGSSSGGGGNFGGGGGGGSRGRTPVSADLDDEIPF